MKKMKIFFFFTILAMLLYGCKTGENMNMTTGKVRVNEVNKSRTHELSLYQDIQKNLTVVEGNFMINGQAFPGKIIYTDEKSLLYKPNPDQCVVFPKNFVIYGFLPPEAVEKSDFDTEGFDVSDVKKDGKTMSYRIKDIDRNQESLVVIEYVNINKTTNVADEQKQGIFSIPNNTQCFEFEDMIKI